MTDSDLVAAFLAKGGKVQQVPEGEGLNLTGREWRGAIRGETPARLTTEQEAERRMEDVREAYHMGGTRAAVEALNWGR